MTEVYLRLIRETEAVEDILEAIDASIGSKTYKLCSDLRNTLANKRVELERLIEETYEREGFRMGIDPERKGEWFCSGLCVEFDPEDYKNIFGSFLEIGRSYSGMIGELALYFRKMGSSEAVVEPYNRNGKVAIHVDSQETADALSLYYLDNKESSRE